MPFIHLMLAVSLLGGTVQTDSLALSHGPRDVKEIALTFDACPSSVRGGFDQKIIQVLADSAVPATFFLSGEWIERHQSQAKLLSSNALFEFGNHSYSHPHCTKSKDAKVRRELEKTESLLRKYVGSSAHLFRPPFGETNRHLETIVTSLDLNTVMYDLASGDPDTSISKKRLVRYISRTARNGSIVVMHVNGRGWHTAEALPDIIQSLRAKGFAFVKVSRFLAKREVAAKTAEAKPAQPVPAVGAR